MQKFLGSVRSRYLRVQLMLLAMLAAFVAGPAMAATTPVDQVLGSITAGQADAIKIAVAVVIALWAIWGIYLMRRKG